MSSLDNETAIFNAIDAVVPEQCKGCKSVAHGSSLAYQFGALNDTLKPETVGQRASAAFVEPCPGTDESGACHNPKSAKWVIEKIGLSIFSVEDNTEL